MPTAFLPESALASAESRIALRARPRAIRLSTSSIPYAESIFELKPRTVAEFYALVIWDLNHLKIPVKITELPSEIPGAIPFSQDRIHCAYDPAYATASGVPWNRVLKQFCGGFIGNLPLAIKRDAGGVIWRGLRRALWTAVFLWWPAMARI